MLGSPAESSRTVQMYPAESRETLPEQLTRLLTAEPGPAAEAAWASFLDAYSGLLLRVARAFWPGYDGALDGYAYMLEELRRKDCQRLRKYAADGRGRFSTWLAVVARRLCLDQYRRRYGRFRGDPARRDDVQAARMTRRCLMELSGPLDDLTCLADPALPDPAEQIDEHARSSALHGAVALLPAADQLLLRLRFDEELTARQIAGLLGLPTPFHVYRRLDAICATLRTRLGPGQVSRPA
jgi:RNA polymerase sigma factor (sigma-70 family)